MFRFPFFFCAAPSRMHAPFSQNISCKQRLFEKGAFPVIVCKFGGTSLCDAARFFRAVEILRTDARRRVAVPSAPGRRFDGDEKITDLLLACRAEGAPFAPVRERFRQIASEAGQPGLLDTPLAEIERELPAHSTAWALSRGEYLSGLLLATLLGWKFLDAAQGVFFAADGKCDMKKTRSALRAALPETGGLVLPGFYGASPDGSVRTFPRGGSDITGAIAAAALDAALYENWTDVPGIFSADPRVVPEATPIASLDYRELRELSALGACVLQEEAVLPVREAGIPIAVRSTRQPQKPGTLVHPLSAPGVSPAVGVTARRGFLPVMVEKTLLRADPAFARKALETLETFGLCPECMPCGVDTLCLVVPQAALAPQKEAVCRALLDALGADSVEVGAPLALAGVVGGAMRGRSGVAARVLAALADAGLRVRLLDYGAGGRTLLFGVNECDCDDAVRAVFRGMFGG